MELDNFPQLVTGSSVRQSQEMFWRRWLRSSSVRAFESGTISFQQFVTAFFQEQPVSVSVEHFTHAFRQWPKRIGPGVESILHHLHQTYHLAILSNNNEVHWEIITKKWGLERYFQSMYSSHLLGKLKPDADIFEWVKKDLPYAPGEILFIDDNALNVEAARHIAFTAEVGKGLHGITRILRKHHLLTSQQINEAFAKSKTDEN